MNNGPENLPSTEEYMSRGIRVSTEEYMSRELVSTKEIWSGVSSEDYVQRN